LDGYAKQTGIDLATHPSARELQNCDTSEDILRLLQNRETAFGTYRDKDRKLIDRLRPVVQIVHAFSGVLGEVAGFVVCSRVILRTISSLMLSSGTIPTDKSNLC
jgi:hypothetical protein